MSKAIAALFNTDAYKLDHRQQYPEGTEGVLSNYTNRASRIDGIDHVVHFGLQAFLEQLNEAFVPFFEAEEDEVAEAYTERVNSILGPNNVGSSHIRALHRLGYLPLVFRSLPEGTPVPLRVPSFTIENTLPEFYWLVNYLETWISSAVWQPSTSATLAWHLRKLLNAAAIDTGQSVSDVDFQGHDFSFRGMAGPLAAAASSAGHLLSFRGSDTLAVSEYVEDYYAGENGFLYGSVPATEHSVMCAGGKEDEQATFERLLRLYPSGIVSVVSDTWNLWNVLERILPNLKAEILARDGKLVIRPDSGNPVDILTGTVAHFPSDNLFLEPEEKGVIELLWDTFGGTVNEAGYKVLDSHIGAIYGDSITYDRAKQITERLKAKGFASTNIVFGVGSYTYQYQTRDTFSSAIKATWVKINGEERAIFKDPITDNGMKKSAAGRLAVYQGEEDVYRTAELYLKDHATPEMEAESLLTEVYRDGKLLNKKSFAEIRDTLGLYT